MVFDPLKFDFAAEGGGSRRAVPMTLPRINYGVAGASGGLFGDVTKQAAKDPRPGQISNVVTPPPPPPPPNLDPPTTNGVTQPFRYSNELPPLTPKQQRALMERRRAATRSFEETEDRVGRETSRAEGNVLRQQGELDRNRRLQSRAGMQTLAGRGVGRSPMFVNPFQRQLTEQSQRQTAELQSGLAGTLSQLRSALQQAEISRDREFAQIDFDAVDERTDVGRLLGA